MLYIKSHNELSDDELIQQLRKLRKHSYVESSHYAVAAIMLFKGAEENIYVCGVNVENAEHNRLGMHAEHTALAAAQTLLGGDAKFDKLWIMAAPDTVHADNLDNPAAGNCASPCGQCRQILVSLAKENAEVYSFAVNGTKVGPYNMQALLPMSFSEKDVTSNADAQEHHSAVTDLFDRTKQEYHPLHLLDRDMPLSLDMASQYLQVLKPHMIVDGFKTSNITACILQLTNGRCFPGVLVQDIAFLTADTLYTAFAMAVTELGADSVCIDSVHVYGNNIAPACIAASARELLQSHALENLDLFVHDQSKASPTAYDFADFCYGKEATNLVLGGWRCSVM